MFSLDEIVNKQILNKKTNTYVDSGISDEKTTSNDTNPKKKYSKRNKFTGEKKEVVYKEPSNLVEQEKILKNRYLEISKNTWMDLPLNTYVRYIDENGVLKTGGRITAKIDNTYFTITKTSLYTRTQEWTVDIHKIKRLFKFVDDKKKKTTVEGGAGDKEVQKTNDDNISEQYQDTLQPTMQQPSRQQTFMSQLGDKLLFDDNSILADRIDKLEREVSQNTKDLSFAIKAIKHLNNKIIQLTTTQQPTHPNIQSTPRPNVQYGHK
jgi:hypothetical protein